MGFATAGKYLPLAFMSNIAIYNISKAIWNSPKDVIEAWIVNLYWCICSFCRNNCNWHFTLFLLTSEVTLSPPELLLCFSPLFCFVVIVLFLSHWHTVIKQDLGNGFGQLQKLIAPATQPITQTTCITKHWDHCLCPKIIIIIYLCLLC